MDTDFSFDLLNQFYICAAQLEATPDARYANSYLAATTYVDGEQQRCYWNGQPHASTSGRDALYNVYVSNIQRVERKRPGIMDRIRGNGVETQIVFTLAEVG